MARGPTTTKTTARQDFTDASPKAFGRVQGQPTPIKLLGAIEKRAAAVRARAIEHHRKFEDRWTAKEVIRLWQHHLKSTGPAPAPPTGATPTVSAEELAKIASRNVRARLDRRLTTINTVRMRMGNSVFRSLEIPRLKPEFEVAAREPVKAPTPTTKRMRRKQ